MSETMSEDVGVLRTRGMKVLNSARTSEASVELDPIQVGAPRERKTAAPRAKRQTRAERASPSGLAGWVLGLMARREGLKEARHLRVLETQALGGRKQLMLVVCDGERFLVGSGADRVDTIVRIGAAAQHGEEPCS